MSRARDAMLVEELRQKDEALRLAHLEIRLLKTKLDALARRVFGRSSERLDAAQLQLLLEGLERRRRHRQSRSRWRTVMRRPQAHDRNAVRACRRICP
jgi:transposase